MRTASPRGCRGTTRRRSSRARHTCASARQSRESDRSAVNLGVSERFPEDDMANPLRKTMVYLGLADEDYDEAAELAAAPAPAAAPAAAAPAGARPAPVTPLRRAAAPRPAPAG